MFTKSMFNFTSVFLANLERESIYSIEFLQKKVPRLVNVIGANGELDRSFGTASRVLHIKNTLIQFLGL